MELAVFPSNKQPVILELTVETKSPQKIRVRVSDRNKDNTVYTNRFHTINGSFKFFIRMPQSPPNATISVFNEAIGNKPPNADNTFRVVSCKPKPFNNNKMKVWEWKNKDVKSFVEFAQEFSENAGILSAGRSIYTSNDGKFRIDYVDVITDGDKALNTPARINREKGIIDIAKDKFIGYTIPMRFAILCHEFSHFYLNKVKDDEVEADLNALLIYLGMGYPRVEAYQAFTKVFIGSPSDLNKERIDKINQFITNFEKIPFQIKYS